MDEIGVGIVGLGDGGMTNARVIAGLCREGVMRKHPVGVGVVDLNLDEGLPNARALAGIPGVRIAALCDPDEGRRYQASKEFPFPGTLYVPSVQELVSLPAVQLVVVATPDHLHLEPARMALAAGKLVFVEKPIGVAHQLAEFAMLNEEYPGKLFVGEKYSHARPIEALLRCRKDLGEFLWGDTAYTMWQCDRIMGGGKWRTETRYNPAAGGLSHNFMTALLVADSAIAAIQAKGEVLTYHTNLDRHGGYDTMIGTLRFMSGRLLNWAVCLAVQDASSPYAHRTVAHTFQFRNGVLTYGPQPAADTLIAEGMPVPFEPEPEAAAWAEYNLTIYRRMWLDILAAIDGQKVPRHSVRQALNVAHACAKAFDSAAANGAWREVGYRF
ncbi:gfo/Idh/MocA family oxidoreductase [Candidatus Parcubacteria bacterium]|nr:MAG: gfo/Idh/MocA family oxidoreductase [Candidatus Parcubacteria bacterium]